MLILGAFLYAGLGPSGGVAAGSQSQGSSVTVFSAWDTS